MRKHSGQSIIEYSIIAILVMLSVVIMGPYVLRSVNAHFKIWDDQVQDSANDRLTQASDIDLPANCRVNGPPLLGSCGVVKGKTVTCQANERYKYYTFNPPGCYASESCTAEHIPGYEDCCAPVVRGDCGYRVRDAGALNRIPLRNAAGNTQTLKGETVYVPVPIPGNTPHDGCYYGEREVKQRCGPDAERVKGCIVDTFGQTFADRENRPSASVPPDNSTSTDDDDPSCSALCYGDVNLAHGELCKVGGIIAPDQDTSLKAIARNCTETSYRECEFRCLGDFIPSVDNKRCEIRVGFQVAPITYSGTTNYSFQICTTSPYGDPIFTNTIVNQPDNNAQPGSCDVATLH